ncbi:acylphosphatase [Lactobacillus sp. LC28-10]|uniref:acylphosphatase n=1 Tax=Secundilactobacillus angelensis TaxID=2722706 RepID=A0ABX1L1T2_9LACO|nr:acylphosphatase [Secundilactobacillus angelensis]MCH5463415.1 acylphosphatase [Secundilactobacillus angelensis]NLR19460.1 acylphosphatase [Secundilactobacillus angelensis]
MKSVIISIHGRVQGVGFRWTTARLANRLNVVGWVRNERDGSVTVRAQADETSLEAFIEALKQSPTPYAKVSRLNVTNQKSEDFTKFEITD